MTQISYEEAYELYQKENYHTADYYRVERSVVVALGLHDNALDIMRDVLTHNSEIAFEPAFDAGAMSVDPEGQHMNFADTDVFYQRHVVMQCAFPKMYMDYFGGECVWDFNDPRMQELIALNISCLTNKLHPSDYYGSHEIVEAKRAGRPKVAKEPKAPVKGFKEWVDACTEYKAELSKAWKEYLTACSERKRMEQEAKEWRDKELNRLRDEMSAVSAQYTEGMRQYETAIHQAKLYHTELKMKGKPKRGS